MNETKTDSRTEKNGPSGRLVFGGMVTQWEWWTPEAAASTLATDNTANRNLNEERARQHARDRKSGKWEDTHQGIAFDDKGVLLDGQTRLKSIEMSGIAGWFMTTRGLTRRAMEVIDRHRVRSLANTLQILGVAHACTGVVAIARAMRFGTTSGAGTATDSEMLPFVQEHLPAILHVNGPKLRRIAQAPALAALARAYYHVELPVIDRFIAAMLDQIPLGELQPGDASARRLAKLCKETRVASGGTRQSMYRKAQRAIKAFTVGEDLERIYEVDDDFFPLPVPASAKQGKGEDAAATPTVRMMTVAS